MLTLTINGQSRQVDAPEDMPLLWALRDHLNLVGTKYGCGIAQCGACTVHVGGKPVRSCQLAVGDVGRDRAVRQVQLDDADSLLGALSDVEQLLALAKESFDAGDMGGAAQAYAEAMQVEPENAKAIAGLARCYLAGGDAERAQEVVDMAPAGAKDTDLDSVRAALALAMIWSKAAGSATCNVTVTVSGPLSPGLRLL